jgi:8-amino-7-oxononanoate synthase
MSYLARVREALTSIDRASLRRSIREQRDDMLDFSSNDYLGLSRHPAVLSALSGARRAGSGGSRLLAGAYREHRALEETLAGLTRREDALLFSSGYLAALGATGALARFVAAVYSDELNHASLIDGLRLAKLPRTIYPHLALPEMRTDSALVVSETRFGMDGDALDIAAFIAALGPGDVALLDEAHAFGITGPRGGGAAAAYDDERLVVLGTLSKAAGTLGGFIAGPAVTIEYLRNSARSFIFDTSLPPSLAAAARRALEVIGSDEGETRRAQLRANIARLKGGLAELGLAVGAPGAVQPIGLGDPQAALRAAAALEARGLRVPAIRPPSVPAGTSRLRITLRADHSFDDVDALLDGLQAVLETAAV